MGAGAGFVVGGFDGVDADADGVDGAVFDELDGVVASAGFANPRCEVHAVFFVFAGGDEADDLGAVVVLEQFGGWSVDGEGAAHDFDAGAVGDCCFNVVGDGQAADFAAGFAFFGGEDRDAAGVESKGGDGACGFDFDLFKHAAWFDAFVEADGDHLVNGVLLGEVAADEFAVFFDDAVAGAAFGVFCDVVGH